MADPSAEDDRKVLVKEFLDLDELKEREAKSRAVVLEILGDIPDADVAPPKNVLFVCKLNPVTEQDDLKLIFSRFGPVRSCDVIRDYKTGDSLQYAFVEFETEEACNDAYFKMQNVLVDDRRIHVDFCQSVSGFWKRFKENGTFTREVKGGPSQAETTRQGQWRRDYDRYRRQRGPVRDVRRQEYRNRGAGRDMDIEAMAEIDQCTVGAAATVADQAVLCPALQVTDLVCVVEGTLGISLGTDHKTATGIVIARDIVTGHNALHIDGTASVIFHEATHRTAPQVAVGPMGAANKRRKTTFTVLPYIGLPDTPNLMTFTMRTAQRIKRPM
ncbi:RNA recognition motif domain containing protein, putative [Babesia bigemina]|uniref:Peptidyl-prolyl cis-trans isomerase n=1 Tax=Babesia bigemina TaxID=5866 RepID=A0A061D9F6_BABBI|nr:RNA recognition motif domain containing protein, putative [Babesia bigemina]CDR96627.1 RNA recognition motif domain containing protein, putative [Babesia bigemina]|eukprot:XP_012768813.1 RNA recognition motif domain containing protein, putative [Babesia bigemina]